MPYAVMAVVVRIDTDLPEEWLKVQEEMPGAYSSVIFPYIEDVEPNMQVLTKSMVRMILRNGAPE